MRNSVHLKNKQEGYYDTKHDIYHTPRRINKSKLSSKYWSNGEKNTVLFEVDENRSSLNCLHIANTSLTINTGKSSRVKIEMMNEIRHDIMLKNRIVLVHLQLVKQSLRLK